jgi:hypothetical protein
MEFAKILTPKSLKKKKMVVVGQNLQKYSRLNL